MRDARALFLTVLLFATPLAAGTVEEKGYHRVFDLEASYRSGEVVELRGGGEPFLLDLGKKVIYFAEGEAGVFCRVRIYRGEPLD